MNSSSAKQTIWVIKLEKTEFTVTFKWSIKIPHVTIHFGYNTVVREALTATINNTSQLHINTSLQFTSHTNISFLTCVN